MYLALSGQGGVLTLESADASSDYFDGTMKLRLLTSPPYTFSTRSYFPLTDLLRLSGWIRAHVNALQVKPDSVSEIWVPLDLTMQFQCQQGELFYERETLRGDVSVLILLLAGEDENHSRVYAGAQIMVDISNLLAFCDEIDA